MILIKLYLFNGFPQNNFKNMLWSPEIIFFSVESNPIS